jgi:ABC-type lipoprotein export system ATPase subunit
LEKYEKIKNSIVINKNEYNIIVTKIKTNDLLKDKHININKILDEIYNILGKHHVNLKNNIQKYSIINDNMQLLGINNISDIKDNIDRIQKNINYIIKGLELEVWQKKLDKSFIKLEEKRISLAALEELRILAENAQYKKLNDNILRMNDAMNVIFAEIYDRDISIELSLFKKVKSTKLIKPNITSKLYYKGMEYENMKNLCGSEKNRLNLGMMIALNLISTSPLMILDEAIHFLDDRLKDKCARAIHNLIKNKKTIIMTNHQSNDAEYKHIVELKSNDVKDD